MYHFKFKTCFLLLYSQHTQQTTYIPYRTMQTTSKVQSERTKLQHLLTVRQFFTCLNCISLIKFHFSTIDLFPCKQPAFYHVFLPHRSTTLKKFTWDQMPLIVKFSRNSPAFYLFYKSNLLLTTLDLTQSRVNSL